MNNLATMLRGSRTGEKIVAEISDATLIARRRLVAEIELLRTSNVESERELARADNAAKAKLAAAEILLQKARQAVSIAMQNLSSYDTGKNLGIARFENELKATAPARIDQQIDTWRAAWERARSIAAPLHGLNFPATEADMAGSRRIASRCEALMEAINRAHQLKLAALTAEELETQIADIDAALPSTFG